MGPGDFRFEPDLASASTIPSAWYRDPGIFDLEARRVFGGSWQLAGHAGQVSAPGDYFTCEIGGEPLVVARGEDGLLRAFSNVCRHRAGPVARGAGSRKSLMCGYHGWTYGLDGSLLSMPEWEGVRAFDRARQRLPPARLETWGPFLFVCLDEAAPPLADSLGSIPEQTGRLPLSDMKPFRSVDYEVACNWKVYVDNYLEGYHIPIVHPALFRELDYRAYRVETLGRHSRQHAPLRDGRGDSLYADGLPEGARPEALYYWVFPNLMLNFYPDNLQVNLVLPLSPERTRTRFEWHVLAPDRPGAAARLERAFAFADQVQREDIEICEAVQKGLRSRTYDCGRYSVRRENGVHHFHGLLTRALQAV